MKNVKVYALLSLLLLSACYNSAEVEVTPSTITKIQQCFNRGLQVKVFANGYSAEPPKDRGNNDIATVVCYHDIEYQSVETQSVK